MLESRTGPHRQQKTTALAPRRLTLTSPMFPEGLTTLVLMVGLVACAGYGVQNARWDYLISPLGMIAIGAALVGALMAKLRVIDSIAHLAATGIGVIVAFAAVIAQADELGPGLRTRVQPMFEIIGRWYVGTESESVRETYAVSILLGLVVWLVGYLASWSLFRRGWIAVGICFPGFLMLITMAYAPDPDQRYLLYFALIAIPLMARFTLFRREREWRRMRLQPVRSLAPTVLAIGAVIAILATSTGWNMSGRVSQAALQPLVSELTATVQQRQQGFTEWMQGMTGSQPGNPGAGEFTTFDDAFTVGGPLNLTDEPEALVFADTPPYLAAQRYDEYSGRGWSSTVNETFNANGPDGRRYSPEMRFRAGQNVDLTENVSRDRTDNTVVVRTLGTPGDRLLTVDSYSSSSIETSVRMSWIQLTGQEYSLAEDSRQHIPRDLVGLADLLGEMTLDAGTSSYGPLPNDADDQRTLEAERVNLSKRFLDVRWTADGEGRATSIIVTGQIPVYDDVEAVFSQGQVPTSDSYRVTGAASTASGEALGDAGVSYPDFIAARYLQLPPTVTTRTTDLATQLSAGSSNPYETARNIETYLRANIAYDESVTAPPIDEDLVDYVLFKRPRGYCEYYASAMAVMLRTQGIPARVVVGYYPGQYDSAQGGFLYRQQNAHAWVEVFFPAYGWIRFEPTASQRASEPGRDAPDVAESPSPPASPDALASKTSESVEPVSTPSTTNAAGPAVTLVDDESDGGGPGVLLVAAVVTAGFTALAIGLGVLRWLLPLRGMTPSAAMFYRLRRLGRLIGVQASPASTPREIATSITEAMPAGRASVKRIVDVYELDNYGPSPADNRLSASAIEAWQLLRRDIPGAFLRMKTRFRRRR